MLLLALVVLIVIAAVAWMEGPGRRDGGDPGAIASVGAPARVQLARARAGVPQPRRAPRRVARDSTGTSAVPGISPRPSCSKRAPSPRCAGTGGCTRSCASTARPPGCCGRSGSSCSPTAPPRLAWLAALDRIQVVESAITDILEAELSTIPGLLEEMTQAYGRDLTRLRSERRLVRDLARSEAHHVMYVCWNAAIASRNINRSSAATSLFDDETFRLAREPVIAQLPEQTELA